MKKIVFCLIVLGMISTTTQAQLVVKNASNVVLMEVENQSNDALVTIGSGSNVGTLITDAIGIGVAQADIDSRIRIKGHQSSTLPIFGTYNSSILAEDYSSSNAENQVVIEGIGTAMSSNNEKAHLGVQGMLLGGASNDVWITSASLGYHNTRYGNTVAGVSSNVLEVDGYVPSQDLMTAVFIGENKNSGSNHYGLNVTADRHYLNGNLIVEGKVGVNIGNREPATWFEIYGQPYISANNAGLMMKSADGSCWQVRVDNSGNLTTTSRTCP